MTNNPGQVVKGLSPVFIHDRGQGPGHVELVGFFNWLNFVKLMEIWVIERILEVGEVLPRFAVVRGTRETIYHPVLESVEGVLGLEGEVKGLGGVVTRPEGVQPLVNLCV